jgi:hypothetical protein
MVDLATAARSLPDVVEGIACAGTKLESRTFATNAKTFLFVSAQEARLKLDASAAAAKRLGFEVGGNGWVKLPFDALPAAATLRSWIAESHGLMAAQPVAKKPVAKKPAKPKRAR